MKESSWSTSRSHSTNNCDAMSAVPLMKLQGAPLGDDVDDSDQVSDLDDPLESVLAKMKYRPQSSWPHHYVSSLIFTGAMCFIVGFVGSYVTFITLGREPKYPASVKNNLKVVDFIVNEVSTDNIGRYHRNLTRQPHIAGTEEDLNQALWLSNHFTQQGFDKVSIVPYTVFLSYPVPRKSNVISVVTLNNRVVASFKNGQSTHSESEKVFNPPFNAFSASGKAQGDLVYVNFGHEEDFRFLDQSGISVKNKIVLAKLGKVFQGNIVYSAEGRGAMAVVLFPDPQQFAPKGREDVFPKTIYLPEDGVPVGVVRIQDGDPLTPNYPSVDGAFRIKVSDADLPTIPVLTISYKTAEYLLKQMKTNSQTPDSWGGDLQTPYSIGPGFQNGEQVLVDVNVRNKLKTIYNVIATLQGSVEPDRYVLVGNNRDSWTYGAVEPSSGTASMMELARVFGRLKKNFRWKPRRSLVFCSWGAHEYGYIGSVEWTEELKTVLDARSVAYINVDMAVAGNYTLEVQAVPLLYNALYEAATLVPNPNPVEVGEGRKTVFDTWLKATPSERSSKVPLIVPVSSRSGLKPFIHNLGIPSADLRYTYREAYREEVTSYPLHHTKYDTFRLVASLMDDGFHFIKAVTQLWGILVWKLVDSTIIPFDVTQYSLFLNGTFTFVKNAYGKNISLDYLSSALSNFSQAANTFQKHVGSINQEDPLAVRQVNDQLMKLERAFISQQSLSHTNTYNHVLFVPRDIDSKEVESFGYLMDLLTDTETVDLDGISEHQSVLVYHINSATKVLQGVLDPL